MSTFAVIGVTGYAGGHITTEALSRGHQVIGVSRTAPTDVPAGLTVRTGPITDTALVREVATDADALVIAVHGTFGDGTLLVDLVPDLLAAAADGGARLGFVGGAGSLLVAPGGPRLIDTPEFPEQFKGEAGSHAEVLEALRASKPDAEWFYVSPAAGFGSYAPGEPTGHYRVGGDQLLVDGEGNSFISGADFALAFVDELERPAHRNERFGVAY